MCCWLHVLQDVRLLQMVVKLVVFVRDDLFVRRITGYSWGGGVPNHLSV